MAIRILRCIVASVKTHIIVLRSTEITHLGALEAAADRLHGWFGPASGVAVSAFDEDTFTASLDGADLKVVGW
jgi:hypothetical protein